MQGEAEDRYRSATNATDPKAQPERWISVFLSGSQRPVHAMSALTRAGLSEEKGPLSLSGDAGR